MCRHSTEETVENVRVYTCPKCQAEIQSSLNTVACKNCQEIMHICRKCKTLMIRQEAGKTYYMECPKCKDIIYAQDTCTVCFQGRMKIVGGSTPMWDTCCTNCGKTGTTFD